MGSTRIKLATGLFFWLLLFPASGIGADYFVKTPANGGNDSYSGLDWDNAKASISAAMALAGASSVIRVAAGTYNEKIVFSGYDSIQLLGGHPASGAGSQNPAANPTIIDGDGLASGAMVYIPIKPDGMSGYNGIVVDGFTIRNGTLTGYGCAGIESHSLNVTIKRNTIENNRANGTYGHAGGIYIFCPLNATGRAVIEQNIIRNNEASAIGGIFLDGAAGRTRRYPAYLVNNLIHSNRSTTTDTSAWNWGAGAIGVIYPAGASIVHCTIAGNEAVHPTSATAGVRISGIDANNRGVAAIANSIIWHPGATDIAADANAVRWIAYSCVADAAVSGTGVIHTNPQFTGGADYRITSASPCKNTAGAVGTVLTGTATTIYDIGYKNPPYNLSNAQVTYSWGDGTRTLSAQWQYNSGLSGSYGYPVGTFFGTSNANCTADPTNGVVVANMAAVDASTYSYGTTSKTAKHNYPFIPKETVFWRGTNGYSGAWLINGIAATYQNPYYYGRLAFTWYFQCNGSHHFDAGIRSVDLDGNPRPAESVYDMGAYEVTPDSTPPTGSIVINGGAACTPSATVMLTLAASDPGGVAQMQFSNDNAAWTAAEPYGTAAQFELTPGTGLRTAYVKFKDNAGNWSGAFNDSIFLNTVAGDVNLDGVLDLADAIIALQTAAGISANNQPGMVCGDTNADGNIALPECIYTLQEMAGIRP